MLPRNGTNPIIICITHNTSTPPIHNQPLRVKIVHASAIQLAPRPKDTRTGACSDRDVGGIWLTTSACGCSYGLKSLMPFPFYVISVSTPGDVHLLDQQGTHANIASIIHIRAGTGKLAEHI